MLLASAIGGSLVSGVPYSENAYAPVRHRDDTSFKNVSDDVIKVCDAISISATFAVCEALASRAVTPIKERCHPPTAACLKPPL